jgi:hypothetical protein
VSLNRSRPLALQWSPPHASHSSPEFLEKPLRQLLKTGESLRLRPKRLYSGERPVSINRQNQQTPAVRREPAHSLLHASEKHVAFLDSADRAPPRSTAVGNANLACRLAIRTRPRPDGPITSSELVAVMAMAPGNGWQVCRGIEPPSWLVPPVFRRVDLIRIGWRGLRVLEIRKGRGYRPSPSGSSQGIGPRKSVTRPPWTLPRGDCRLRRLLPPRSCGPPPMA